jgi:hypothetical protein
MIQTIKIEKADKKRGSCLKPWIFGIAAGVLVVMLPVILPVRFPSSYTFCLSGHSRDLINGVINWFSGLYLPQTFISRKVLLLTSPAVIAGAYIASAVYGERRRVRASKPLYSLFAGAAVMLIGITIFGCPTRLIIRAGYGDIYGIAAAVSLFAGTAAASIFIKLKWRFGR